MSAFVALALAAFQHPSVFASLAGTVFALLLGARVRRRVIWPAIPMGALAHMGMIFATVWLIPPIQSRCDSAPTPSCVEAAGLALLWLSFPLGFSVALLAGLLAIVMTPGRRMPRPADAFR